MDSRFKYLIFMFLVIAIFFISAVEAYNTGDFTTLYAIFIYSLFPIALGFAPVLFHMAATKYELIKTITVNEPRKLMGFKLGFKYQLIIAAILVGYVSFRVLTVGAFIDYPIGAFLKIFGKFGAAFGSALFGIGEDWIFWGFLSPTLIGYFANKLGKNTVLGLVPGMLITSIAFTGLHIFVYHALFSSISTIFVLSIILQLATYFTNSLIIANAIHGTNNFIASFISAHVALVI